MCVETGRKFDNNNNNNNNNYYYYIITATNAESGEVVG
jgi:hypothetical protein